MTKAVIAASFDSAADSYEQVGVEFFAPLGAALTRRADPRRGERVLDLGCGRGHVLFPVAEAVGPSGHVLGTDLSARMVELCTQEVHARGLDHVEVGIGDAADPDFPPASFDLVTAGMVMFFVPAPREAVRNVATLLRAGGRFAMSSFGPSDPKFDETMRILYSHRVGEPWEENPDKPFASAASITGMLTDAGFVDVEVSELQHDIVFDTPGGYWAWVGSHGGRILMDQLTPDQLLAARTEVDAMLDPHRDGDGRLVHRSLARFTTARRAE